METHLHTVIVEVRDDNVSFTIHSNKVWSSKLPFIIPSWSELIHKFSIGLEDEDAGGFVVHNVNQSIRVDCQTFWTYKKPIEETRTTKLVPQYIPYIVILFYGSRPLWQNYRWRKKSYGEPFVWRKKSKPFGCHWQKKCYLAKRFIASKILATKK